MASNREYWPEGIPLWARNNQIYPEEKYSVPVPGYVEHTSTLGLKRNPPPRPSIDISHIDIRHTRPSPDIPHTSPINISHGGFPSNNHHRRPPTNISEESEVCNGSVFWECVCSKKTFVMLLIIIILITIVVVLAMMVTNWHNVSSRDTDKVHLGLTPVNSSKEGTGSIVPENSDSGILVASLKVTVNGKEPGDQGSVKCTTDDMLSPFAVQKVKNSLFHLVTNEVLDREERDLYSITIICQGTTWKKSITHNVEVLDVNDCIPVFEESKYIVNVHENNPVGKTLLKVQATDCDTGLNGKIRYDLHHEAEGLVHIDPVSGVLQAARSYDRETMGTHQFRVSATDQGHPKNTAWVNITLYIIDVNDEHPMFPVGQYHFSVREERNPGALVGRVKASDEDDHPHNVIHYTLQGDVDENFTIDQDTGVIRTKKVLQFSDQAIHKFSVFATNISPPYHSSSVAVYVTVLKKNGAATMNTTSFLVIMLGIVIAQYLSH